MEYGTVCTGIGAPEIAWKDFENWNCKWQSETEAFPCKVLGHHYPDVPNLGDMTKLESNKTFNETNIDLLVGGTPCQSFSLAGLRGGMADDRGNLALTFCKLLIAKQPKWFLWENVPGVFSSFTDEEESKKTVVDGGTKDLFGDAGPGGEGGVYEELWQTADFATLLQGFRECGYSVIHRVLDSQYFGVPQRRRRVFVVGHLGDDWRPPFAVLFERESLRRDITPRKEKRKAVAGNTGKGIEGSGKEEFIYGIDEECNTSDNKFGPLLKGGQGGTRQAVAYDSALFEPKSAMEENWEESKVKNALRADASKSGHAIVQNPQGYILHGSDGTTSTATETDTALSLRARTPGHIENSSTTVVAHPILWSIMPQNSGKDFKAREVDVTQPLMAGGPVGGNQGGDFILQDIQCPTLTAYNLDSRSPQSEEQQRIVNAVYQVTTMIRRLTPLECCRLQGFPDDYLSSVPSATDTAMYKALGNSMTTQVIKWIGERIDKVDKILKTINR